jgi:hypothetical protein
MKVVNEVSGNMRQVNSISPELIVRIREALVRSLIWAFIGTLYGLLFALFLVLAEGWEHQINPYFLAGILAGTIGALIYSSMRLAVLMAIIITPITSLVLLLTDVSLNPLPLIMIIGAIGGVIGALYGRYSKASRVCRADAKTLTGFCAGFLVSLGYLIIAGPRHDFAIAWVIGFMCPLTGWLYVIFVPTFIRYFDNLLPAEGDGALVGIGVSVFISLLVLVMTNSINADSAGTYLPQIEEIQALLPQAVVGGLLGGGIAGLISGLFFKNWQDL